MEVLVVFLVALFGEGGLETLPATFGEPVFNDFATVATFDEVPLGFAEAFFFAVEVTRFFFGTTFFLGTAAAFFFGEALAFFFGAAFFFGEAFFFGVTAFFLGAAFFFGAAAFFLGGVLAFFFFTGAFFLGDAFFLEADFLGAAFLGDAFRETEAFAFFFGVTLGIVARLGWGFTLLLERE